jgi:putative membrane protein insertion efficiency factor
MSFVKKLPVKIALSLIKIYQFLFSFDHSFWAKYSPIKVCIYHPSCSQYTYEAIEKFGLLKGSILGIRRIIRCNPFNHGGHDPVPQEFSLSKILKR